MLWVMKCDVNVVMWRVFMVTGVMIKLLNDVLLQGADITDNMDDGKKGDNFTFSLSEDQNSELDDSKIVDVSENGGSFWMYEV